METKIKNQIVTLDHNIKLSPTAIAEIHYLQTGTYPDDNFVDANNTNGGINEYNKYIQEAMNYIIFNAAGTNPTVCNEAISVLEGLRAVFQAIKSFRSLTEYEERKLELTDINKQ